MEPVISVQKQKLFKEHIVMQLWIGSQAGVIRPNKVLTAGRQGSTELLTTSDFGHAEFFYLCKRNPLIK